MSKFILKRSDGGITVLNLIEATDVVPEIAKWESTANGVTVISWREMPDTAIPTDRTFRAAWRDTTPELVVDIDMSVARNVWRDNMRRARAPLLAALDVQFMQALEQNKPTAAITAQKQALRDVTADPAIEAAQTPEQLKAVWPAVLRG